MLTDRRPILLANARVIDGTGAAPTTPRTVHVREGKIVAIGKEAAPAAAAPDGGLLRLVDVALIRPRIVLAFGREGRSNWSGLGAALARRHRGHTIRHAGSRSGGLFG